MSTQLGLWDDGPVGAEFSPEAVSKRASLYREIRYLLAISAEAGRGERLSPAGLAHSLGVCLIEDSNMARGKGKPEGKGGATALPRFVDVKLSSEEREAFAQWGEREGDLVGRLQGMADSGYRVGVSWSSEQQAYVVSLTCRDPEGVNNGLCMTSFAKTLITALWLALYKHYVVTGEHWVEGAFGSEEEFG